MTSTVTQPDCPQCCGERLVANTPDREPWSAWANLPARSAIAVRLGLVQPMPCPACTAPADPPGTTTVYVPADELPDPPQWCCLDCNGDPDYPDYPVTAAAASGERPC